MQQYKEVKWRNKHLGGVGADSSSDWGLLMWRKQKIWRKKITPGYTLSFTLKTFSCLSTFFSFTHQRIVSTHLQLNSLSSTANKKKKSFWWTLKGEVMMSTQIPLSYSEGWELRSHWASVKQKHQRAAWLSTVTCCVFTVRRNASPHSSMATRNLRGHQCASSCVTDPESMSGGDSVRRTPVLLIDLAFSVIWFPPLLRVATYLFLSMSVTSAFFSPSCCCCCRRVSEGKHSGAAVARLIAKVVLDGKRSGSCSAFPKVSTWNETNSKTSFSSGTSCLQSVPKTGNSFQTPGCRSTELVSSNEPA